MLSKFSSSSSSEEFFGFSCLLSPTLNKRKKKEREKLSLSCGMSSSAAAAAAAALLLRRSSQRCVSLSIARDGGATASASGRCIIAGRSLSNLHRNHHQRLSTTAVAALESATSPLQRLFLDVPRNCSRGFAGSRPFSSSTAVTTPSSSPSPAPSEPSPSFVRLNNIFPSPGSKSQVRKG